MSLLKLDNYCLMYSCLSSWQLRLSEQDNIAHIIDTGSVKSSVLRHKGAKGKFINDEILIENSFDYKCSYLRARVILNREIREPCLDAHPNQLAENPCSIKRFITCQYIQYIHVNEFSINVSV